MKIGFRWERFKYLIGLEIKAGGLFALFFNILYFSIYLLILYITSSDFEYEYVSAFLFIFIPSITIVIIGGILIAIMFSLIENARVNVWTASLGFIGSAIASIFVNYILWLLLYQYAHSYDSFIERSFTIRLTSFFFSKYPSLIPNIVDVLLLTYVGWKINKLLISNVTLSTEE